MKLKNAEDSQYGLSKEEAARRLKEYGRNEIQREKTRPAWRLFIEQFKSPLVLILIAATILSLGLGENMEAIAISAILIINALIGFFQEYRAETAILALQEMTAPRARVIRDGRQVVVLAHEVVPGDLLILEAGDIVAADADILQASSLQVNEALLTGESMPAQKLARTKTQNTVLAERTGELFMGTSVATGTAQALVTATGMKTELGSIAHLIASAQSGTTPLQLQLVKLGKILLMICLAVVGVVVIIGLLQGRAWLELLVFSISLAVAAVPEGMPAIVTVALALGVQRLAARNALIRKLPSVETLGSVSVICTDKTGTLTTGNMRVREVWGEDQAAVVRTAASCCDAELDDSASSGTGDPTELAILIEAFKRGFSKESIEATTPRVSIEPFDSERRRMSILRSDGINYVKGAVESIFALCGSKYGEISSAVNAASDMSARGLRVLAIATGNGPGEQELKLIGLLGLADPPRAEAAEAIKEAREAGIIPIMITGDHPKTAAVIARELGLVIEGETLESCVHARATPQDKLNLVRKWKAQGHIVAMTGDGVNDAPALREAHIGIAMGKSGTEVTRQAADLILADDNFSTIVAAVREGRNIFQNIRRAIAYLLTGNLAEIAVVLGAIAFGLPLPLLAAHLLWINLVTDALPALTLIVEPLSPNIMKKAPRPRKESLLGHREWRQIIWVGLLEAMVALSLYWYLLNNHGEDYARSMLFTELVFSQMLRSFGARSNSRIFWKVGALSNLWLLAVVLFTATLQVCLHYIPFAQEAFALKPLSVNDFALLLVFALIPITVIEIKKLLRIKPN
ncbi:MAG: cation-translocating P-type ATPase [Oligoflexales bacterium]|nr:cation-translocating P-type ATPase [Oligoflexales bacterium]